MRHPVCIAVCLQILEGIAHKPDFGRSGFDTGGFFLPVRDCLAYFGKAFLSLVFAETEKFGNKAFGCWSSGRSGLMANLCGD